MDLVSPMLPAMGNGKIGQHVTVQGYGFLDQFPAYASDDLLAPGEMYSREGNPTRSSRSTQLAAVFYQYDFSSCPAGLEGGNHSRRPTADHQNVGMNGFFWYVMGVFLNTALRQFCCYRSQGGYTDRFEHLSSVYDRHNRFFVLIIAPDKGQGLP